MRPLFVCLSFCSAAQTAWSRTWTESAGSLLLSVCCNLRDVTSEYVLRVSPVFTTQAHRFSNRVADIYPYIDFGPLG